MTTFKEMDVKPDESQHDERTIVIVGGVAGGASAAARARRCNEHARIILIEKDEYVSFANCGLPYYVGGEIADREDLLVATPERFRNRFNIDVRTRAEVLSVDRGRRSVRVRNAVTGAEYDQPYDRLILATGASPIVPPIDGVRSENVFTLRNIADTDRIKAWVAAQQPKRAVVVGAGFIGLEMVEQLHHLNIETALVELLDQVLPPLDPEMARIIEQELGARDVALHLGDGLAGFDVRRGRVAAVKLNSGTTLNADLVILGIGVRPNVSLAKDAGVELGETGGIRVNAWMQTADPDIYAVGDAVEYVHGVLESPMRMPLAGPANRAGRIAGQHAATDRADAAMPVLGTAIVRVFDKTAAATGLSMKHARKTSRNARAVVVAGGSHAGYYPGSQPLMLKLVYEDKTGRVLGAQCVGGDGVDKRIDVIATAIQLKATVRQLAGIDLAYAPPYGSAKDPVHMAAFAACNDLDGIVRFAQLDDSLDGRQIVDVRSNDEFAEAHVAGAIHIPLEMLRDALGHLDPTRETVVICLAGQRAYIGARILQQRGFERITVLTGGMMVAKLQRPADLRQSRDHGVSQAARAKATT